MAGYNFQTSGVGIQPQAFKIRVPPPRYDLQKGKIRWGGDWIPHTPGKYLQILACGPPNYSYHLIERSSLSEEERSEIIRFLLTLELWERTPGEKYLTAYQVWAKSLIYGPSFASELSDAFDYSWRTIDFDSYNFLFPSRFLPRWVEGSDDLKLCAERTYSDPDVLDEFQHTLQSLLKEIEEFKDGISLPTDEEIIFEKSTTTSYLAKEDRKLPHWEASFISQEFNEKELQAVRAVVPVYPGGIRDTIIADISANNSIRWLERSMRHILQYVPESAVTLYSTSFQQRLEDVVYTKGHHILRDIKKCGLTYNVQDIFPVIMEELLKFTGDRRFERMKIFQNFWIQDDDDKYQAHRGYGLGMANHIVTLCNIVIYRMCRNALADKYDNFKIKNITGNDDQDTVVYGTPESLSIAEEYLSLEKDIHGSLGNMVHYDKSVIKTFGLFYETYDKKGWRKKEALICNALACAYLAPSVRVAKHYIYSQSDRFSSKWAQEQLNALAHWWGAEFFDVESELHVHFEVGGWLNTSTLGLKTTLRDIDELNDSYDIPRIAFAYETCKQFITPPRPLFKKTELVRNFKYLGMSKETNPKVQMYTLGREDLIVYYKKLTKFQRKYETRLDKYESRVHPKALKKSKESLQKALLKQDPWYAIPDSVVVGESFGTEAKLEFKSEFGLYSEDIISDLIYDEQSIEYDDLIVKWDPKVPTKTINRELPISLSTAIMCSQFSNSGYLPALEYHLRYKCNPKISKVLGRLRIPPPETPREKVFNKLSLFKKRTKKKKIPKPPILEDIIWGGDVYDEPAEIPLDEYGIYDNAILIQETKVPEPLPQAEAIDPGVDLDNVLDLLSSGGHLGTIFTGDHFDESKFEVSGEQEEEEPSNIFADNGDY